MAGGDSLVAHRGVVGHGTELCAGIPGRHPEHNARRHQTHSAPGPTAGRDNGGVQRPVPSTIPDSPGSYQFKDGSGRIIYVGKAKSLRSRLSNYFAPLRSLRLAAEIVPCMASTKPREIASPRPVPGRT